MKKKVIATVCIIFAVLLIASVAVIQYLSGRVPQNPPGTVGNTAGNLYNNGLARLHRKNMYSICRCPREARIFRLHGQDRKRRWLCSLAGSRKIHPEQWETRQGISTTTGFSVKMTGLSTLQTHTIDGVLEFLNKLSCIITL